MQFLT